MPYKISGTTSEAVRLIVIDEGTWLRESNTEENGSYEITGLTSTQKLVVARRASGESSGYGNITPEEYT